MRAGGRCRSRSWLLLPRDCGGWGQGGVVDGLGALGAGLLPERARVFLEFLAGRRPPQKAVRADLSALGAMATLGLKEGRGHGGRRL